jgi:hypothetical protein
MIERFHGELLSYSYFLVTNNVKKMEKQIGNQDAPKVTAG